MKTGLCEIVVVLDRSGSMEPIRKDMEGGFDTFIAEQRKVPGECRVSLYQFDIVYEAVYEGRPIADVPPCSLIPRGGTALWDAVGMSLQSVDARIESLPESERPEKLVFLVITDGHENSSREYKAADVRKVIEQHQQKPGWQFHYLGAEVQSFDDAAAIGMDSSRFAYKDSRQLYQALHKSVSKYRTPGQTKLELVKDLTTGKDDEDEDSNE
jgi:uncharacterized protein YegL